MTYEDWTIEEQNEVLQFYGLDSLCPTEWQDHPRSETVAPVSVTISQDHNEQLLSSLAALDSARQLLREDCDPLGIKDSNFIRQLQAAKAATAGNAHHRQHQTPSASDMVSEGMAMESTSNLSVTASTSAVGSAGQLAYSSANSTPPGSLLVTNAAFSPRIFLREVHADTSFAELKRGRENLRQASKQRNESLKNLVKQNFDRFVNAKNATELVFRDMQQRKLTATDHGMRRAMDALASAYQQTLDVFGQLMSRREQEARIRQRLELFERYDFIFSLGHRLEKSIRLGAYQSAVSDYRKARSILADVAATGGSLQRILQKIWAGHVERTLVALRRDLSNKLANPIFSYEVHAKLIDFLLDLDAHPNPVNAYWSIRKDEFFAQAQAAADRATTEIAHCVHTEADPLESQRLLLGLAQTHQFGKVSHLQIDIVQVWKIRSSFLMALLDIFKLFYGNFGKFLSALVSGRFAMDSGEVDKKIKAFASELAEGWPRILASVINFAITNSQPPRPSSLVAAYYVKKHAGALCGLVEWINSSGAGGASKTPASVVKAMEKAISQGAVVLLESIWQAARADFSRLPHHETWQWCGEGFDLSTVLIKAFESLLLYLLEATETLMEAAASNGLDRDKLAHGLDMCLANVIAGFLDALLELSGPSAVEHDQGLGTDIIHALDTAHNHARIDDLTLGYRRLAVITNVIYLRETAIPQILTACPFSLGERAQNTIMAKIDSCDRHVRQAFMEAKRTRLVALLHVGIVDSTFDWSTNDMIATVEVRPYVLALLLELVSIQTQIYDVSSKILRPLMSELVLEVFQEALKAIRLVREFGIGGYWQARLEVTFLQHKLITIMSEEAMAIFNTICGTLDALCPGAIDVAAGRSVDDMLMNQEQSTQMAFVCFQYT